MCRITNLLRCTHFYISFVPLVTVSPDRNRQRLSSTFPPSPLRPFFFFPLLSLFSPSPVLLPDPLREAGLGFRRRRHFPTRPHLEPSGVPGGDGTDSPHRACVPVEGCPDTEDLLLVGKGRSSRSRPPGPSTRALRRRRRSGPETLRFYLPFWYTSSGLKGLEGRLQRK